MVVRDVYTWEDTFQRPLTLTTTPEGGTGWTVKDTSVAGAPTYLTVSSDTGELALTLAANSEAEIVTAYHNDVLCFDLEKVQYVEWIVKVGGVDAVTTIVWGVGSAQNDTTDSVTNLAWFRMEGSASTSNVVVETDDGTTDNDDKATGKTLSTTYKKFVIDFTDGLSDVKFYIDGERVADSTTFSMAAAIGRFQPFVQLQKASGTGTPSITIDNFKVVHRNPVGA
jgi:hypothetical protein